MPGVAQYDTAAEPTVDASAISDYQKQLGTDEGALADLAKQQQSQMPQFTGATENLPGEPQRRPGITSVAPFLIGLAALGGKAAGLHATTMLGATNGMVQGLIQGNEEVYRQQKEHFDRSYQQYRDKWDQQNKIFNEMRQVYKGRVDADQKALQFARQLQHDDRTATLNDAKMHLQAQEFNQKLDELIKSDGWKQAHGDAELSLQERKLQAQKDKAAQEAGNPANAALAAALIDKGVNIQGYRGKALQTALTGLIARHPDKSDDEIAEGVKSGQLDMKVASVEGSKLAAREASIAPIERTIVRPGGFLDQAEKAITDVNFPALKKKAELERYGMEQRSDPKLSAYTARVTELRQEYAIVLAKGGLTSDASRAEAEHVVPQIITPAQFKEIKLAIKQGIEAAKKGVHESIQEVTRPEAATPTAPVQTTPPNSPPGTKHWGDLPD